MKVSSFIVQDWAVSLLPYFIQTSILPFRDYTLLFLNMAAWNTPAPSMLVAKLPAALWCLTIIGKFYSSTVFWSSGT